MSRRLLAAITLLTSCAPVLAQLPYTNANSYELDNGIESFAIFVATTTPTPGNEIAGDGIVNGSPANQMFWQILPKELLNAGNGTNPGTMELVSFEVSVVVNPGTRTCASGHAGETVMHVVTSDPTTYPMLAAPGIPFTPTAHLRLNLADPLVFALTPAWDGVLVPNTTDYDFPLKHTYDAPLNVAFTGPIAPPGLPFILQAFIVNFAGGPPFTMVSTNAIRGTIY